MQFSRVPLRDTANTIQHNHKHKGYQSFRWRDDDGMFFFLHFVKVSSSVFIFMSFQFCPLLCSEAHTLWLYCTLRDYIFNTKHTILKCVRYLWYTTTFFLFDGFFFLIQGQLALWLLNCNQLLICCWELHVWTFSSA